MNVKKTTLYVTQAALIAAMYFVINLLQNTLLPGTTSMAIQFRFAEALCVLAMFTTAAIPGLGIGCMLFNLTTAGSLPLDFIVGTIATVLSTLLMYLLRNVKLRGYPWLSMLMPVVFNAVIVGWELTYYGFNLLHINMLYVAAGEAAVIFVLGTALYFVLQRHKTHIFSK
ncbi:MAG: QueT transporter family protein [Oscillospiraceae bacterium]|nr:QueT transporter family protein [Oscillospiraceae bacterium]